MHIDPEVQAAYDERAKHRENNLLQYATRVNDLEERLVAQPWERLGLSNVYEVTISIKASMTEEEQLACTKALFSEKGTVAQCLNRRNRRGARVPADGALAIRSAGGRLRALHLAEALTDEDTLGFQGYRKAHDNISNGWSFGCEERHPSTPVALPPTFSLPSPAVEQADRTANPRRILHTMRTERGAAALGIGEGFTVEDVFPRSGDTNNGMLMQYTNDKLKRPKVHDACLACPTALYRARVSCPLLTSMFGVRRAHVWPCTPPAPLCCPKCIVADPPLPHAAV